ncbi:MAG TPA: glycosyl hydrolase family 18 protein [Candidatus Baltobacteraceae bacterium]|nr:glycosyl hydrolase family 18 protein [Candidatus Baltobacteraceae bacterium]
MTSRSAFAFVLVSLLAACGGGGSTSGPAAGLPPVPTPAPASSPSTPFVGFWQSWSDTSGGPFSDLSTVPKSVNTVDVAFSVPTSNAIADPQNTNSLVPGIAAIHANGGKVLLSFGGGASPFNISDDAAFTANLGAYFAAHSGYYDGVDFDDEQVPWDGQAQLVNVINATRSAFPNIVITYDAFQSGAYAPFVPGNYDGEDVAILQQAGASIDWVNVMDYNAFTWMPPDHPACLWSATAADSCYEDAMTSFAAIFPKNKIVMGLLVGKADDGRVITPSDAATLTAWAKASGYRGVMIWSLNHDGAYAGVQPGTYVNAIANAL